MNTWVRKLAAVAASLALAAGIAPIAGAASYVAPSHTAILKVLARANEIAPGASAHCTSHCEHLGLAGKIVVVRDGHGGWITAVPVVRWPTADGYGQYVLFWHDTTFVGAETLSKLPGLGPEAAQLGIVRGGLNRIVIKFAVYKKSDAMCCPSLPPVKVTYWWNGKAMVRSGPIPSGAVGLHLSMVLSAAKM